MSELAKFIRDNIEEILAEWEDFAQSLPVGDAMDIAALRDHAKEMLGVIAADLERPQSGSEQSEKSMGRSDAGRTSAATAAQEHGAGRAGSGFSVEEMVAEFRALRASVIRLWTRKQGEAGIAALEDLTRFNEAVDQAIAESIAQYTTEVGQSKDRFLAILGHDLRTPLGAIITSAQFMLDLEGLAEPHLALITGIGDSARHMNQMVIDLLDFTRTRFGDSIPIERDDTDAAEIVRTVVAEIRAQYAASELVEDVEGDLRGHWDAARLRQALTNLVANAVQHGATDSPIRVTARGERDNVVLTVHNDGPAIPASEFDRIFDAMSHVPTEGARDRRHLGLGLYIVDKIVKAHGGSVDVSSSAEQGTTFTVLLPRTKVAGVTRADARR
jgi:signal transduction histidine kinase